LKKISEFSNLRAKYCCVCDKRLDTARKTCIRRINDETTLAKISSFKDIILTNKKNRLNTTIIKIGDIICGTCKVYRSRIYHL